MLLKIRIHNGVAYIMALIWFPLAPLKPIAAAHLQTHNGPPVPDQGAGSDRGPLIVNTTL